MAATISAIARGDDVERDKLGRTCPKIAYRIPDPEYSDKLVRLQDLALGIECELRGCAIDFQFSDDDPDEQDAAIGMAQSIAVAWEKYLLECGIDPEEMDKASPKRHGGVTALLTMGLYDEIPEVVEAVIQQIRDAMDAA